MVRVLKKKDWFHPDGFPIAVERRDPQEPFGPHRHEFSELVIVTGGTGLHVTGDGSWPLAPGVAFVIGGPRTHSYADVEGLRLINILFDPGRLHWRLFDLPSLPGYHALFTLEPAWRERHEFRSRLRLGGADLETAVGLVDRLDEELTARAPAFGFLSTAIFMQIVGHLSRCYGRSKDPDSRALLRIGQAISRLESDYADPIDVDTLADLARLSRRSFCRVFHAATGDSPINYLIRVRLNHAAALLRQSDHSVTDIAFRVGFSDGNYFTRQFRRAMGVAPRTYRQRHRRPGRIPDGAA